MSRENSVNLSVALDLILYEREVTVEFSARNSHEEAHVLERWGIVCSGDGGNREIRNFCSQEMKQEHGG